MTWSDHDGAPPPGTVLCRFDALADGVGTAFPFGDGPYAFRLFVIRRGDTLTAYVNACSHLGIPLNPGVDHTFLTPDGTAIRCQHHGAQFAIDDGRCLKGDCDGIGLTPVPLAVVDGAVVIGDV